MIDTLKSLRNAGIAVLMGARPYPTGTDTGPEWSVVETWRIKQLAEELKKLNGLIERGGWNVPAANIEVENEWRDGFDPSGTGHYTYDTGKQTLFVFNLEPAEAEAIRLLLTEGNNCPLPTTQHTRTEGE